MLLDSASRRDDASKATSANISRIVPNPRDSYSGQRPLCPACPPLHRSLTSGATIMADADVATKAPESDAGEKMLIPGDTSAQTGTSLGVCNC